MQNTNSNRFGTMVDLIELDDNLLDRLVGAADEEKRESAPKPSEPPEPPSEDDEPVIAPPGHPPCYPPALGEMVAAVCVDRPPKGWQPPPKGRSGCDVPAK